MDTNEKINVDINNEENINLESDSDDDIINQLKDKLDKKKKALNINDTIKELEKDVKIEDYKVEDEEDIKRRFINEKGATLNDDAEQKLLNPKFLTEEEKDNLFTKENLDNSAILQNIQDQVNGGHFETGEIHKAGDIEAERLKFEQEENERLLREQEEDNNALIDPEHVINNTELY